MKIKSFKFLWAIFLFFIILNYNRQSFQKYPKYPFPPKKIVNLAAAWQRK